MGGMAAALYRLKNRQLFQYLISSSVLQRLGFPGFRHGPMPGSSGLQALFPEGNVMPDYRVYLIDRNNRVIARKDIVAPNDEAALQAARLYADGVDVEVWDHARKVGRIGKN
jgi:hypothetical protein